MFRSWRALCVVFAVAACGDPAATEADGDDADTQAPSDSASDAASDLVSSPDVVDAELVDADLGDSSAGDTADGAQSDSTDAADAGVADAGPSDTAADSSSDAAATGTDTAPGLDADASPAVDTADTTSGLDADTSPTVDTGPACGTTCELLDRDGAYLLRQTAAGAAEELNDDFGAALATADLDADGLADLVIGGPGENGDAGVVFVFRGAAGGLTDGAVYLASTLGLTDEPGARFGTALAAGDINGDGRDDVVAGAPGAGGGAGAVVVSLALSNGSLGPGTRLQQPDLSCGNAEAGDAFGEAVPWVMSTAMGSPMSSRPRQVRTARPAWSVSPLAARQGSSPLAASTSRTATGT